MKELAHAFLIAAQQLADAMLLQVNADDPELAQKVADAVQRGESLVLSCDFGSRPCIELVSRSDYETTRRVASLPLGLPARH